MSPSNGRMLGYPWLPHTDLVYNRQRSHHKKKVVYLPRRGTLVARAAYLEEYKSVVSIAEGSMKTKWKVLIVVGIVLGVGLLVGLTVNQTQKNVVTVQTGKVMKQDIASVVTASGEIKPLTYVNVGANAGGRIVRLLVKEGDKVKKGQLLAQLENIQSGATVEAMRASLSSSETDALAQDAALKTAVAQQESSKASLAQAKLDFDRAAALYKEQLTSKAD